MQTVILHKLLNADDVAKNTFTDKMQETMDRVKQAYETYYHNIRTEKTGVVYSQHLESPSLSQP